jgi:hypothetical protein
MTPHGPFDLYDERPRQCIAVRLEPHNIADVAQELAKNGYQVSMDIGWQSAESLTIGLKKVTNDTVKIQIGQILVHNYGELPTIMSQHDFRHIWRKAVIE